MTEDAEPAQFEQDEEVVETATLDVDPGQLDYLLKEVLVA